MVLAQGVQHKADVLDQMRGDALSGERASEKKNTEERESERREQMLARMQVPR